MRIYIAIFIIFEVCVCSACKTADVGVLHKMQLAQHGATYKNTQIAIKITPPKKRKDNYIASLIVVSDTIHFVLHRFGSAKHYSGETLNKEVFFRHIQAEGLWQECFGLVITIWNEPQPILSVRYAHFSDCDSLPNAQNAAQILSVFPLNEQHDIILTK